jgi:K+-sensing histidine kinase KdpD
MAQIKLKRLLTKDLAPLLSSIVSITDPSVGIYDAAEQFIIGKDVSSFEHKHAITVADEVIGWVKGQANALAVATLLSYLAAREVEEKLLANEVLDKYREINLLYNIAEKLTACRGLKAVAQLALEETQRLIRATSANLMVLNETTQQLEILLASGWQPTNNPTLKLGEGIEGWIASTGKAEIVNDVASDARYRAINPDTCSMLCAPLKAQEKVIGVLCISNRELVSYTAAELKLLTAIALQSAPAIESARFHEQQMEAARQREAKLKEQLLELRIEIDEAKRAKQVAEITESDFFQTLQDKAKRYRKRAGKEEDQKEE